MKKYGFYLNGEKLIKTVTCSSFEKAKGKLDFIYPINFNIQIKEIK
jgi:hypothetical protein